MAVHRTEAIPGKFKGGKAKKATATPGSGKPERGQDDTGNGKPERGQDETR